jgi:hypothetical protein
MGGMDRYRISGVEAWLRAHLPRPCRGSRLVAKVDGEVQRQQFQRVVIAASHARDVVAVRPVSVLGGQVATAQVFEKGSPQNSRERERTSSRLDGWLWHYG